jgi:hypothetical protein
MSVSHEEIMAQIMAMKSAMATKDDLVPIKQDIAALKATQDETKEIVEVVAAVKTGSRAVVWLSKFTAGLIAVWVLIKGGAQFLVDLGAR